MVVDQNVSFLYFVDVWTLHFLPDYNVCLLFSPDLLLYSLPINSNTYRLTQQGWNPQETGVHWIQWSRIREIRITR